MKTFMLKSLEIIEEKDETIYKRSIPLIDGLIINREDDKNQWIIEAYIDMEYAEYMESLQEENEVMVQVKITKDSNAPATFITSIISINTIGKNMNVLFKGTIVDRRRVEIEEMLEALIEEDYQGYELLQAFKKHLKLE